MQAANGGKRSAVALYIVICAIGGIYEYCFKKNSFPFYRRGAGVRIFCTVRCGGSERGRVECRLVRGNGGRVAGE